MIAQDRRAAEELRCKLDELIAPSAVPGYSCLKSEVDALIAAALQKAREEERPKWQPIETAPKDGERILASHSVSGHRRISWASQLRPGWWHSEGGGIWSPTHWMPLPDPPEPFPARMAAMCAESEE